MLVSYVLTAFNNEAFIEEAVRSALAQEHRALEVILSDDCSTDHTFDIMSSLASEYTGPARVVVNQNESNLGIVGHMNKAYLELATGDIIIAAHGDDISSTSRAGASHDFLAAHPEFSACSFSTVAIDSNGARLSTPEHSTQVSSTRVYTLGSGGNIPAPSRAFRAEVMRTFGPIESYCPTEDEVISSRALILGNNALLPQTLVKYRKHSGSHSRPELFPHFPLEAIHRQQLRDLDLALRLDLITADQLDTRSKDLARGMARRKAYRRYFASPTEVELLRFLLHRGLTHRERLSHVKQHLVKKYPTLLGPALGTKP